MKVYLIAGNISWLDEAPEVFDACWDITPIQEEILRNDGTADYQNGKLVIIPRAAEVVEQESLSKNILTKREFLDRITPDEYAVIKATAAVNNVVDYFWQKFLVSEDIDITHPDTVAGINMMEQAGLLSAGRALEILS